MRINDSSIGWGVEIHKRPKRSSGFAIPTVSGEER